MTNLLRISEAASMALHTMALLAADPAAIATTADMASTLGVSEAHLSKVLQRLGKSGLVKSVRGPKGGFTIGEDGDKTTLLEVYEAIEGPLAPTNCLLDKPVCGESCIMGDLLCRINGLVRERLSGTKVSEVTNLVPGGKHA